MGELHNTTITAQKKEELFKNNRETNITIDPDAVTAEKVKWIDSFIENKVIQEPEKEISEAEFLVLLFKIYNVSPLVTDNSDNWAAGYYEKAEEEYGYKFWEENRINDKITKIHAFEMMSSILGEELLGEKATDFFMNTGFSNLLIFKTNSQFISRKEGINIVDSVSKSGFYTFQKLNSKKKETFVFLGDSISLGWNINKQLAPSKYGFPNLVGNELSYYHIYNLSMRGQTTTELLNNLENPLYQFKLKSSKAICIDIGSVDLLEASQPYLEKIRDGNGALPSIKQASMIKSATDDVITNTQKIISKLRAISDSPIYLYSLYNPIPIGTTGETFGDSILMTINKQFKKIAKSEPSVIYIDSFNSFKGNEKKFVITDEIHPTYEGQKVLASLLINEMSN